MNQNTLQQANHSLMFIQEKIQKSSDELKDFQMYLTNIKESCVIDRLMLFLIRSNLATNLRNNMYQLAFSINKTFILHNQKTDQENILFQSNTLANFILTASNNTQDRAQLMYEEAIEPFELFVKNYNSTNEILIKNMLNLLDEMNEEKHKLEEYEKRILSQNNHFKKPIFQQSSDNKSPVDYRSQYESQIKKINSFWDALLVTFQQGYDKFELNEESKLSILSITVQKFSQCFANFFMPIDYSGQTIEKLKVKQFILYISKNYLKNSKNQKKPKLFSQMIESQKFKINCFVTIPYEKLLSKEELIQKYQVLKQDPKGFTEDDTQNILQDLSKKLILLITSKIDFQLKDNTYYILKDIQYISLNSRKAFIQDIYQALQEKFGITVPMNQNNIHIFRILFIKIFRNFENEFTESSTFHKSKQFYDFIQLLQITLHFNFKQKPFISLISPHCNLFYSLFIWKDIFEVLEQDQRMLQRFHQLATLYINPYLVLNYNSYIQIENEPEQLPNIRQKLFKNFFKKAKDHFIPTEQKGQIPLKEVFHAINLVIIACNLNPEFSSSVILNLIKIKEWDRQEFIRLIQIQEGNQMLKPIQNYDQFRFKNLKNKILHFQGITNYCILKCLKFLNFKENFVQILLISKQTKQLYKDKMIRYYLSNSKINKQIRLSLWKAIANCQQIDLKKKEENYKIGLKNNEINESAIHHIGLDKGRSLNTNNLNERERESCSQMQEYIENTLEYLLQLYAFENKQVSYYQGMNMLMAFFLYTCYGSENDKEYSYQFFDYLISKMQKEIFMHGLKQLRIHFYILDRLIAIHVPQIFQKWKQLEIEGGQFATVWYVTLFTYSLQINKSFSQDNENQTCFDLMDIIIANNWAGYYSAVIAMIYFYKELLLSMDQSETLIFLNHIARSSFFYYPIEDFDSQTKNYNQYPHFNNLKMRIRWFKIKKSHLTELEKEYNHLREKTDHLQYKE